MFSLNILRLKAVIENIARQTRNGFAKFREKLLERHIRLCFLTRCVSLFPLFFQFIYCFVAAIYANKDVYIIFNNKNRSGVANFQVLVRSQN